MTEGLGYIKVLRTGPGTSIQDLGRIGFAEFGVPSAGAMDTVSAQWANTILRNRLDAAVLEVFQPGLKLQFMAPAEICIAGAEANMALNGKPVSAGTQQISGHDSLEIGAFKTGSILYLGINGGFLTEEVMASRSWFAGITGQSQCRKEDRLTYWTNPKTLNSTVSKVKWNFDWIKSLELAAYPGPEWELLDGSNQKKILDREFTISVLRNRMAVQLEELLPNSIPEMATAPVYPGTVQLTSGGKLMVLMKDAQVTGGYPRVLQLTEKAVCILAQKRPGEKVRIKLVQL